jgi:hypothetical protein
MHDGLRDGTITLTFRNWSRPQAKVGGRYRTGGGDLVVDSIEVVRAAAITDDDARRAGSTDAATLRREMRWGDDDLRLLRIGFHREEPFDRPPTLLGDDVIEARLERLDRAGTVGPWTRATLDIIARRPGVRAGDLAAELGRERLPFKADVRKLKRLGLTESLDVGYRLSARGRSYLDRCCGASSGNNVDHE